MVGVTVNETPLQVMAVISVMAAAGLMFIVIVKAALAPQLTFEGVTKYVAVVTTFVVFVNTPLILLTAASCVIPPVNPIPVGADQV